MGMKDWQMLNVNSKYENDILQYCKVNNIEDVSLFVTQCFKQGFDIKRYGFLGNSLNEGEKHLITEVIVEKRIEIPVEVIKEVIVEREVIKEVPIEVIKEVPVEKVVTKIEYISDKESENELLFKIQQLEETIFHLNDDLESEREEFSTKTQETAKIFQQEMSKKDNSLDELRRNLDIPVTNNKLNMLQDTLQNLRNDLSLKNDKINELEKINQELQKTANLQNAIYMKGSNLNSRI